MNGPEELPCPFTSIETSMDDLASAGWTIDSESKPVRFEHPETGQVQPFPQWVCDLIERAQRGGAMGVQARIRMALGINSKGLPPGHIS